jgi:hypothetical protein
VTHTSFRDRLASGFYAASGPSPEFSITCFPCGAVTARAKRSASASDSADPFQLIAFLET